MRDETQSASAAHEEVEIPLLGGDVTAGVVRVGDTVRRPRGSWSPAVTGYLRHLESVGFSEAQRHLGIDDRGRDIFEFVPGAVPSQPVIEEWAAQADVLVAVAEMLARLHEASSSFVPAAGARWFGDDIEIEMPPDIPREPAPDIVSHFDITPQNVVFGDRLKLTLIDFDLARPGSRLADVVNTAMWWVPLFAPIDRDPAFAACDAFARLARFAGAYRLSSEDRVAFCGLAIDMATRSWYRMRANAQKRGGGWARMWNEGVGDAILRRRQWLIANRDGFERVLANR